MAAVKTHHSQWNNRGSVKIPRGKGEHGKHSDAAHGIFHPGREAARTSCARRVWLSPSTWQPEPKTLPRPPPPGAHSRLPSPGPQAGLDQDAGFYPQKGEALRLHETGIPQCHRRSRSRAFLNQLPRRDANPEPPQGAWQRGLAPQRQTPANSQRVQALEQPPSPVGAWHASLHRMNESNNGWNWISAINSFTVDKLGTAAEVLSSLATLTCVCGMMGNGLVVWLLSCRGQRTPFCTYVLHLAVADFLFLLCTAVTLYLETPMLAYEVMHRVKFFAYTASLSLLMAISTQRCLSVLFPIWYKCHRPQYLSAVVCALLWALSLLMSVVATLFCSEFWLGVESQCFMVDSVFSFLIMGIFTPVMVLSSVTLFVRVRRSSRQWGRRPTRLYVVVLASVVVFLICALPLSISWYFLYWLDLPKRQKILALHVAYLSSALSSSANPVIYFVVGSQGRRGLWEPLGAMLRRALREEPEGEGRETPSTGTNDLGA
ncbi:mas-related G-protein coupled receptor member D-like [Ursus americanus]|uniref:mas-related G-protein coupled receptor member D-like n=1 Tax=Ursus americanus TaxID=9643 RepID=UPI001E67A108|nr:mas-related G-protein coupled receptor member D-like [Ursus americanus]